ncbi:dihydrofolate reductase family protein [Leucobacter sp. NPDC077196]|uniref:dihydrofolate reductase family protein n=1 Tax=Leucobacter sp. NPDC077196 TaxID=3154959 RepID=UPI003415AC17
MRTPFDEAAFSLKGEELEETTALMFGRRSYEAFAPIWRDSEDHAAYRDLPKYVVSTSLDPDALVEGWGPSTVLRSEADVAELKESDGGAIFMHGSGELALRLAEAGLIDRYHMLMFPVMLGAGKRVFPGGERAAQELVLRDSQAYGNGVVKLIYDVAR